MRYFLLLILFVICCAGVCAAAGNEHFVAPDGSAKGDGTIENPWDLQTALNQPASVQPGDTIWLRAGSYQTTVSDGFVGKLKGTEASPITVRNYNGERATIDGQQDNEALDVTGSYTRYWGLEVMSSCTVRNTGDRSGKCSVGVGVYGPGNKFINMVVHDTSQGFSGFNAAPDTEFYGNLSYYNGFIGSDRNHGHGMYLQNISGAKVVEDNFVGDNADEGIQIYGSGSASLINITIEGNTIYNNSSWPAPHYQYDLIIAGGKSRKNIQVRNNYIFFPAGANAEGFGGQFGQYDPGEDMTVTNNIFANGYVPVAFVYQSGPVVFTGNTVVAGTDALRAITVDLGSTESLTSYMWDHNTYFDQSMLRFYRGMGDDGTNFSGTNETFESWKMHTGFDTHSIYKSTAPSGVQVFVRPNKYEPKRANITVFNWDKAPTVQIDLSGVLASGDRYVIQDAQNFYGQPIASGMYSGGKISIHMTDLAKAQPVGFAAPAHTAPQLGTFIVLPVSKTAERTAPHRFKQKK
jgi:hypothetical protein